MGKSVKKKKRKPLPAKVRQAASVALIGNDFWMQRTKHGRDALFTEPLKLLQAAEDYITGVIANPLYKAEWKDYGLVSIPVARVPTLTGFCGFLNVTFAWWRQFKNTEAYKSNKDFATVMQMIEDKIYTLKFEGASAGFFNANIIARDLGLIDRIDQTSEGQAILAPIVQVIKERSPKLANNEQQIDS